MHSNGTRGQHGQALRDLGLKSERLLWPSKGPAKFEDEVANLEQKVGLTTLAKAVAWAQTNSMWPDTFGLACCAIEMMSIVASRYDIARFGMEPFRGSPRQADLLIVSGRVSHKMAAPLRQIYDQMLEPKWVIAMGACASSGGMFNNYAIVQSVDKIVPVDIYVPGCPPRPGAARSRESCACTRRARGRAARAYVVAERRVVTSPAGGDSSELPGPRRGDASGTERRRSSSSSPASSRRRRSCATRPASTSSPT